MDIKKFVHLLLNKANFFQEALEKIQSGEYAKAFILENQAGAPTMISKRRQMAEHPIEQIGTKLRSMMPWIAANKLVDQEKN